MNGDDTLDWAKKPAVPENRKRAVAKKTIEGLPVSRFCPKCALEGKVSPIQLFQINEDEALLMCRNASCTFMQSPYWESLIVKRSISQLPTPSNKRKSLSSGSSQLSTSSNRIPHTDFSGTLKSGPLSRYSLPLNALSASTPTVSSLPNLVDLKATSDRQTSQRIVNTATQQDSSLEGKERKTLVPIAPFLSGHAHSFSSFETNKLEYKLQKRGAFIQNLKGSPAAFKPKLNGARAAFVKNQQNTKPAKRRSCSLDSDSLSSSSSCYDSRPATPEINSGGKKVKSIVVPPQTLSQLINGSMKLEIRKSKSSGADIILRSVKKVNSIVHSKAPAAENSHEIVKVDSSVIKGAVESEKSGIQDISSVQGISSAQDIRTVKDISSAEDVSKALNNSSLEITPVGSLDEVVSSTDIQARSTNTHIEAINFRLKANSIRSHIDIINSHIQAINKAVGCNDLYVPIDFSNLCQKFSAGILGDRAGSQVCGEGSVLSVADVGSGKEFEDEAVTN